MFPDPETFNPLRWVEPGWPTYKEPLTQYPTIINSTQFGYGRRVCQGQTVADEDLLIGIGSVAWLFDIARRPEDISNLSEVEVVAYPGQVASHSVSLNEKASISTEELNTGVEEPKSPTMEDMILSKYSYPGSYPTVANEKEMKPSKKPQGKKTEKIDPTLDFSTLLIAKPLPFKFNLKPRDTERAARVRKLFNEGVAKGDYKGSREYWGEDQGKGKEFGWGKV